LGSLDKRLARLEGWVGGAARDEEDRITREALRRITTEDLRLVHAYLKRAAKGDTEPTEEEEPAILRYEEFKEEVRNERA
jgi:hypothetical protein